MQKRRGQILRSLIQEYILTASPVSSESLAHKYNLGVSSATIRNEVAVLEGEGYVGRPHHSAGAVPSDRGYRSYVESLALDIALLPEERMRIRHQFHQVERELDAWGRLAAAILSDMAHNLALATLPKSGQSRFKRLELISVQDLMTLLVLVLSEASVRQQLLALEEPVSQLDLNILGEDLNNAYANLTAEEIMSLSLPLPVLGEQIRQSVVTLMLTEDAREFEEPYLEGFSLILGQPEFGRSSRGAQVVAAVEAGALRNFLLQALAGEDVQVIIGRESQLEALQDCSLVLSPYGISGNLRGALAVVGPVRMDYDRTIGSIRYLSQVMSELVSELMGRGLS
ncbi:MAG: heat-inducible transcription repressor HrcA [Chloroflexi bacterium]|nr:heat-inducible transcription repressor HrcA [Chloroflexota bacterium]